mmetsp:Transcript_22994/g.50422  ORF Transcript_22994/g.50422 Transcript_22994/m.50422 type:complete len:218 (+) Transcript_22994:295-948(+)
MSTSLCQLRKLVNANQFDAFVRCCPFPFCYRVVSPVHQVEVPLVERRLLDHFLKRRQLVFHEIQGGPVLHALLQHLQDIGLGGTADGGRVDVLIRHWDPRHLVQQGGGEARLLGRDDIHIAVRVRHRRIRRVDHTWIPLVRRQPSLEVLLDPFVPGSSETFHHVSAFALPLGHILGQEFAPVVQQLVRSRELLFQQSQQKHVLVSGLYHWSNNSHLV